MSYLTAIKDYRGILCSFAAAIGVACLCAQPRWRWDCRRSRGLLASIALGYGVMLAGTWYCCTGIFLRATAAPALLQWLDQFMPLALTGLLTNLGLFAHLVIIWAGPIGVQVKGLVLWRALLRCAGAHRVFDDPGHDRQLCGLGRGQFLSALSRLLQPVQRRRRGGRHCGGRGGDALHAQQRTALLRAQTVVCDRGGHLARDHGASRPCRWASTT